MSKAIAIGYISRVSVGNVNASFSEGNVIVAKKVTLPDGRTVPYVSGQAIRRMIRQRFEELGFQLSEPHATVKKQEVTPPCRPAEFIDEDLFGYLDPSGGKRRTSPVRVSAAVGMFPYQGDRDLGTRSFERFGQTVAGGGNMFETEVYNNLFRGAILVELDRVGVFRKLDELGDKKASIGEVEQLELSERKKRVQKLLEVLRILWGGGRTARLLVDFSPRFFAYVRQEVKYPVFLESIRAEFSNGRPVLDVEPLRSALDRVKEYSQMTVFGVEPGEFNNEDQVKEALSQYGAVLSVREAIQATIDDVGRDDAWS